jgi:hypothetical protein
VVDAFATSDYPESCLKLGDGPDYYEYRKGIPYDSLKIYIRTHGWLESDE